jgi:hypothetical protein
MTTKIGCDPELFIKDGPKYISAHGILPGTKEEPFPVEKGAVQVDGLAFEFNIDPVTCAEDFDKNIEIVITQMDEMIKKVDKSLELSFVPIAHFDKTYFDSLPEDSKILGCDPDYDVHGNQQIPPEDLSKSPFRTASGHVHIGWTEGKRPHHPDHFLDCMKVAKTFKYEEFFLPKTMLEKKRLKYYGRNGAFRPKSYGVELRTPSNRWVASSDSRKKIFNNVMTRFTLTMR